MNPIFGLDDNNNLTTELGYWFEVRVSSPNPERGDAAFAVLPASEMGPIHVEVTP